MFQLGFCAITLFAGVLVEPFRVEVPEPGHHQVMVRVAMASDGRFAVAWIDSLVNLSVPGGAEFELYVRFFAPDGAPLTEVQKIPKVADTFLMCSPELAMDLSGNTALAWAEASNIFGEDGNVRLMLLTSDGVPLSSPYTVAEAAVYTQQRTVAVGRNGNGDFAVSWASGMGVIQVQRFAPLGLPEGESYLAHGEDQTDCTYPAVALNDAGDLLVCWFKMNHPFFQVFDAQDSSILPWEPEGYQLDDEDLYNGSRSQPHWLDEDRFCVFWANGNAWLLGRSFAGKGASRHPTCDLYKDRYEIDSLSISPQLGGKLGWFSSALCSDGRFALTNTRRYQISTDTTFDVWYHQAGGLGKIVDNKPHMETALFEYSHPYGTDTVGDIFSVQAPAVACCDDRIVWVYSRYSADTTYEAWAVVTDWDMVGVKEEPTFTTFPIKLVTTLNRLSWSVTGGVPGEAVLTLYNSSGRKVAEDVICGKGEWFAHGIPSGVYFARVQSGRGSSSAKVVVVR